jgi:hypothetical protein
VGLQPSLLAAVHEQARSEGLALSALTRRALRAYLECHTDEKAAEWAASSELQTKGESRNGNHAKAAG